jgi:sulfur carrier protein
VRISVNGDGKDVAGDVSVSGLVEEQGRSERGTAVAINGEVVPKSEWSTTHLRDGDNVEILSAVGGG